MFGGETSERMNRDQIANGAISESEADEMWNLIGKEEKHIRSDDNLRPEDRYAFVVIMVPQQYYPWTTSQL